MKLSITIICTILLITNLVIGDDFSVKDKYLFNFPRKVLRSPVIFPCPNAQKIYLYGKTAVSIDRVICDNKTILPELMPVVERPNYVTENLTGETALYQLSLGFLVCWQELDGKLENRKLKWYKLPEDPKLVSVYYHIRFPDGTRSKQFNICLLANEDDDSLLLIPGSKYPNG